MQNGHDVTNITNISPGLTTMTFTSLTPYDNGSYSAIVFNDVGNLTVYFDLMVLCELNLNIDNRVIERNWKLHVNFYVWI